MLPLLRRSLPSLHRALLPLTSSLSARSLSHSAALNSVHWKVDNPYTGVVVASVPLLNDAGAIAAIERADVAQQKWRTVSLKDRQNIVKSMIASFKADKQRIATDVSLQMGKPLSQALGEVDGAISRMNALLAMSDEALKEEVITADPNPTLMRKITKEPIGVSLLLVPWNYPLLCTVNAMTAALLAGNAVLIKHSDRSPLCADAFAAAMSSVPAAPANLVQSFHASHELVARMVRHPKIAYVSFTGSVQGGRDVYKQVADRFIDVGLELGGKDPAYLTADSDVDYAIANIVDGAMYNAGQSCCAVERVYVQSSVYDRFIEGAAAALQQYKLGDPMDKSTTLGPIAQPRHVAFLEKQVKDAVNKGAKVVYGGSPTKDDNGLGRFFQPTLITQCTHAMEVMTEESFGPIMAVMKVDNDQQAVELMNDSQYGLTASVWTKDLERAMKIGEQINTGTVFMNRCDFLDPYLSWSGRKNSGKGVGLSVHGFAPFVRLKSWNFRTKTQA